MSNELNYILRHELAPTQLFEKAYGNTFPYTGRHQQEQLSTSLMILVAPATIANGIVTRIIGRTLNEDMLRLQLH